MSNLSPTDLQALQRLASSPAAREIVERAEQQRAQQRQDILCAAEGRVARYRSDAQTMGDAALSQRTVVEELRRRLIEEARKLSQLEAEASRLAMAAESASNHALHDLRDLGGEVVERTLRAVLIAERESLGQMAWRDGLQTRPDQASRRDRLRAYVAELEGLRMSDMAPDAIERRCAEIQADVDGTAPTRTQRDRGRLITPPAGLH